MGVAMVTRDRCSSALLALGRIDRRVPVCVIDNASRDGTVAAVRAQFPHVDVVASRRNLGAGGRNVGATRLRTPLIAFADDDSWWARDAFGRAAERFAAEPRLGLLAARVLVGVEERLDPVSAALRDAPAVLGFVACGAIVRREAFLEVGGFDARHGVGGEESRLALDLAAAGWELAYADDVVAHHHPLPAHRPGRRATALRNDLWSTWLRRPLPAAARRTAALLRERRVLPAHVDARARLLQDVR